MRRWAFARISLKLTDAEFFSYTPAQIEALAEASEHEHAWELAVATAAGLNAKWGSRKNPLPFSPDDFMPKTKEELEEERKQQAAAQALKDDMLELRFKNLANELKQPNGK